MSSDGEDHPSSLGVALLPNALTIAGLQHIVNNLCSDVHQSLSHWPKYFEQLKSLEAFLRVEVRRHQCEGAKGSSCFVVRGWRWGILSLYIIGVVTSSLESEPIHCVFSSPR
jgi:hypothetical protein